MKVRELYSKLSKWFESLNESKIINTRYDFYPDGTYRKTVTVLKERK